MLDLQVKRIVERTFVAEVEHYAAVGSTNDLARQFAAAGRHSLPLLIVADEQTAGRGRGTNRWWTGRGGLAFSLLIDAAARGITRERSPLVSLAAAIAVAEEAGRRLPSRRVGLHWPNDVYVEGRKLSGILAEFLADGHAVLGIGINTNNSLDEAPPEVRGSAATLGELTGKYHNHTELLLAVFGRLETLLARLVGHPAEIGRRANALCLQHGRSLSIESGSRMIRGLCAGIDEDGSLLLDTGEGREKVFSGVLR